jgi:hypothetical protein
MMITREEAKRIAEHALAASGCGDWCKTVRAVYALHEIRWAKPNCFPHQVALDGAWIAYGLLPEGEIRSSIVVVIDMTTGVVRYVGDAHDEG